MIKVKRFDLFILKTFLPMFLMTFMICLFIILLQFIWAYVKDFVGKGLEMAILAELFSYAALTMVPLALPLSILLASLMTFGNLSEKFELLAIKASGISLIRVMAPLIIIIVSISVGAFFFQNNVLPKASLKMAALFVSINQKSPELEIPEGEFYDKIDGYNLYVQSKDNKTGLMRDIVIYDISGGFDNAMVVLADSGRLSFTDDKQLLFLTLYSGESFENLKDQRGTKKNVPYRRETFTKKEITIPFDANFNRVDESAMNNQNAGKNIVQLSATVDSVRCVVDSSAIKMGQSFKNDVYFTINKRITGVDFQLSDPYNLGEFNIDREYANAPMQVRSELIDRALARARSINQDFGFKGYNLDGQKQTIRKLQIEIQKKLTLSFACLIFFFIGAPLGAIIGRGGIGTPIVISVLLFIFYYIIDNSSYKMARDGIWPVWQGMWMSSFILLPLGIFFTYKAVNDSALFNKDAYRNLINKILGHKISRNISPKEVVIDDVSLAHTLSMMNEIDAISNSLLTENSDKRQSYNKYWHDGYNLNAIKTLSDLVEGFVDYAKNTTQKSVALKLMDYPYISKSFLFAPATGFSKTISKFILILLPITLPLYLIGISKQKRLRMQLKTLIALNADLRGIYNTLNLDL